MTSTTVRDRLSPPFLPLVVGVLALTLAGCAGAVVDTDAAPADPEVSAPADADGGDTGGDTGGDAGGGSGAELGTITVDSTTYGVLEVVNCEPEQTTDFVTLLFDVIAVAQSAEGDDALFFGTTQEQSGEQASFIDYQGPEGTWSSNPGDATFVLDNGILSGASPLADDANTQSITIQFEFEVPDELTDCS